MNVKTLLIAICLMFSQLIFNSCREDNANFQTTEDAPSHTELAKAAIVSFKSANYFVNSEPFNAATNYIRNQVAAQGSSYVLTQTDLNTFYDKAQIPADERLPLDQVKTIINNTLNAMQMPFNDLIQQLNISNDAKSLAISIYNQSISQLEDNLVYKSLPEYEKTLLKNLNDYKYNCEQGIFIVNSGPASKTPGFIWGGMAGFVVGGVVGSFFSFPVGTMIGAGIGMVVGAVVGAIIEKT